MTGAFTLVDTSVWVDYLRGTPEATALAPLLEAAEVVVHPWVVGELALGHLGSHRTAILDDLRRLPEAVVASDDEVMHLIEGHDLAGSGIGWVDAHLLATALLTPARLWSLDRKLIRVASTMGITTTTL